MRGARTPVTFPMREIPPRMTSATTEDVTNPVIQVGTPKVVWTASATVLAWMPFPVRKATEASMMAKKTASGFQ
jgi:hypothetical protein